MAPCAEASVSLGITETHLACPIRTDKPRIISLPEFCQAKQIKDQGLTALFKLLKLIAFEDVRIGFHQPYPLLKARTAEYGRKS